MAVIAPTVATGLVDGLDMREYRKRAALSSTGIHDLLDAPCVYRYYADHPEARKDTDASDFGSAVHAYLLEGEAAFLSRHWIAPPGFATNKTKQFAKECAEWEAAEAKGAKRISTDDYDQVRRVCDAIRACPDAAKILDGADATERSAFFDMDGVPCKARFDIDATEALGMIADLKVCADNNPERWGRDRYGLSRAIQASFYASGYCLASAEDVVPAFAWIVAPSEPPYTGRVWVGEPSERYEAIARREIDRALAIYRKCQKTGQWPGYGEAVRQIDPAPWMEENR